MWIFYKCVRASAGGSMSPNLNQAIKLHEWFARRNLRWNDVNCFSLMGKWLLNSTWVDEFHLNVQTSHKPCTSFFTLNIFRLANFCHLCICKVLCHRKQVPFLISTQECFRALKTKYSDPKCFCVLAWILPVFCSSVRFFTPHHNTTCCDRWRLDITRAENRNFVTKHMLAAPGRICAAL